MTTATATTAAGASISDEALSGSAVWHRRPTIVPLLLALLPSPIRRRSSSVLLLQPRHFLPGSLGTRSTTLAGSPHRSMLIAQVVELLTVRRQRDAAVVDARPLSRGALWRRLVYLPLVWLRLMRCMRVRGWRLRHR